MTKLSTKTFAAALAALTLVGAFAASSGSAEARPRFGGAAVGLGIAGALIGAAVVSNAYAGPSYAYGYRDCRYVERYNRWGQLRVVKVCDYGY